MLTRLHKTCGEAGLHQVLFVSTLRPKHTVELARQAVNNGCDYLMAEGKDGALNEVVNGVMQSKVPEDLRDTPSCTLILTKVKCALSR